MILLPLGLLAAPALAAPLLLDGLGAACAYGLRQLSSAYAGPCVRVRRSTDNAEADIGFAGGLLDTAALAAHCGAALGYASKLYDLSGNGRHAGQAVAASQAQLWAGSAVVSANGRPALAWGPGIGYAATVPLGVAAVTALAAARCLPSAPYARLLSFTAAGAAWDYDNAPSASLLLTQLYSSNVGAYRAGGEVAMAASGTALGTVSIVFDGASATTRINGAVGASSPSTGTFGASGTLLVGNSPDNYAWQDRISEVALVPSALSAAALASIQANQKTFYGTP